MTSAGRRNTPAQDFLGSLVFLAISAALVRFGFQGSPDECGGEKTPSGDTCVSSANGKQTEGDAVLNYGFDSLFTHQGIQ
ncbi:hypothetical protein ACIBEA_30600 [Streptomyces sp. NPDC051555]|uniref:hypothetical protein n=1 Tax=Streptomyces sp. NPDC051555 TaxID=3365657 RepID=UPI00379E5C33